MYNTNWSPTQIFTFPLQFGETSRKHLFHLLLVRNTTDSNNNKSDNIMKTFLYRTNQNDLKCLPALVEFRKIILPVQYGKSLEVSLIEIRNEIHDNILTQKTIFF